jgi:hypothetical protein
VLGGLREALEWGSARQQPNRCQFCSGYDTGSGNTPVVRLLTTVYQTGVRLTKKAMAEAEKHLERLSGLEQWFVKISCPPSVSPDT